MGVTETSDGRGKENGAYAQIAVDLESQLGLMPRNLDFTEAGVLPKVSLTSYKALQWYGGAPYHDREVTVLMLGGSGGTGTTGIRWRRHGVQPQSSPQPRRPTQTTSHPWVQIGSSIITLRTGGTRMSLPTTPST